MQRRNGIDSGRRRGTFFIWLGAILISFWAALAIWDGFHVFTAFELALGASLVLQGVVRRRAAAKALTALEAEHGPNAGYQEPVQRPRR